LARCRVHPALELRLIATFSWAWLVSVSIWPYEARKELRTGLSTLFLNSAFLYEKLVRAYSTPPAALQTPSRPNFGIDNTNPNEHTSLLSPSGRGALKKTVDEFAAMELYLQRSLISLQGLLDQTVLEPRLKGPFPAEAYRKLLLASQAILDQLHSMRAVTTREGGRACRVRDNELIVRVTAHRVVL
jgi:hypothetical protein